MHRIYELRSLTSADWAKPLLELPIVFTGMREECLAYAEQQGFTWRTMPMMMFLGYWAKGDGDCLIPT